MSEQLIESQWTSVLECIRTLAETPLNVTPHKSIREDVWRIYSRSYEAGYQEALQQIQQMLEDSIQIPVSE